jgi:hypothetical protein
VPILVAIKPRPPPGIAALNRQYRKVGNYHRGRSLCQLLIIYQMLTIVTDKPLTGASSIAEFK